MDFGVRSVENEVLMHMNATLPFLNDSLLNSDRSRMISLFRLFGVTYFLYLHVDVSTSSKMLVSIYHTEWRYESTSHDLSTHHSRYLPYNLDLKYLN